MEATQAQLLSLLDGKKQFTIPIYQRTYSWQLKQCQQLFADVLRIGNDPGQLSHFIGSVVYFKPGNAPITSVPELLVIDGQQRLTTISLLLLALTHYLQHNGQSSLEDESWEEVQETYLVNKHRKDESRYKLLLTRKDKETYIKLIEGIDSLDANPSKHILENYTYFQAKIDQGNFEAIYLGVKKLIIVDVILEMDKDNPQLIFESLNSTGLDLSQADLIRNYILMGQPVSHQTELYEKYWFPMEERFGNHISSLPWFIRDYLTMKESAIPNINLVYDTYKIFLASKWGFSSIEDAVKDLFTFAKYYVRMALSMEPDPDLLSRFKEITKLKIDTSYPFLLAVYADYETGLVAKAAFLEILDVVIRYVFRRAICGIPTNSLNKTFATLYRSVKKEAYLESLKATFLLMDGYRKFPTDEEFAGELIVKDIYGFRNRNYLLESLENWKRKELVNAENYTIEHILPQNPNVSSEWKLELGEQWEQVKNRYLHTLGNLTLTGYNSELSDRPFADKKTIPGGFNTSPLFLNASVREAEVWNEQSILSRVSVLAQRACEVWKSPILSSDVLLAYREPEPSKSKLSYQIDQYEYLHNEMLELYKKLEKRVLNLDASVRIDFKKLYIAFKTQTNFVDVVPQKKQLRLSLNMEFSKINDPKGLCKDVSDLGRWGNGEVEIGLENETGLDYVMEMIRQAFEYQQE
ncbi:DUF262 and DUF1524 domain-containing protein [Pedobacter psychroterrae]|uniref:DUF262 domain-containing protein n=1 Tax=Pedobacter psychroterrae TaxID=2530453 RepID=A0A4R0NQ90_9SPHI|nr:DUF262 and DUF1524 domain-containing protein [Pedobacter psychroterrae]TCD03210.1 DUF262 domain-containing protein [Pedobacter psychroterrae]